MSDRRRPHRGGAGGHEPRATVASRAQRVWERDAAGWSQRAIAAELGISQAAVSKILARVADHCVAERRRDHDRQRVRALNRLAHLFREALRAYEQSQTPQTRRRQRQLTDAQGQVTQGLVEAVTVERDGDPRFLEQAGRAVERAAALQGFTTDGQAPRHADGDPDEARRRLASQLGRLALTDSPARLARSTE